MRLLGSGMILMERLIRRREDEFRLTSERGKQRNTTVLDEG